MVHLNSGACGISAMRRLNEKYSIKLARSSDTGSTSWVQDSQIVLPQQRGGYHSDRLLFSDQTMARSIGIGIFGPATAGQKNVDRSLHLRNIGGTAA